MRFALTLLIALSTTYASAAEDYGAYRCVVISVYAEPQNTLASVYRGATLYFDSRAGTLHGSFDPHQVPNPSLVRKDFVIATPPSKENGLTAVAVPSPLYDQRSQPSVAWFQLSIDGARFKLFSSWIQALVVGECGRTR